MAFVDNINDLIAEDKQHFITVIKNALDIRSESVLINLFGYPNISCKVAEELVLEIINNSDEYIKVDIANAEYIETAGTDSDGNEYCYCSRIYFKYFFITSESELTDEILSDIENIVKTAIENKAESTSAIYKYNITLLDTVLNIVHQIIYDNKYYSVKDFSVSYLDYSDDIKITKSISFEYSDDLRNIVHNLKTPYMIYRFQNGQFVPVRQVYKCINGKMQLFWSVEF